MTDLATIANTLSKALKRRKLSLELAQKLLLEFEEQFCRLEGGTPPSVKSLGQVLSVMSRIFERYPELNNHICKRAVSYFHTLLNVADPGCQNLMAQALFDIAAVGAMATRPLKLSAPLMNSRLQAFKPTPHLQSRVLTSLCKLVKSRITDSSLLARLGHFYLSSHEMTQQRDVATGYFSLYQGQVRLNSAELDHLKRVLSTLPSGCKIIDARQLAQVAFAYHLDIPQSCLTLINGKKPTPNTKQRKLLTALSAKRGFSELACETSFGPYFVDLSFKYRNKQYIIELDGPHHYDAHGNLRIEDSLRDGALRERGITVIRISMTKAGDLARQLKIIMSKLPQSAPPAKAAFFKPTDKGLSKSARKKTIQKRARRKPLANGRPAEKVVTSAVSANAVAAAC